MAPPKPIVWSVGGSDSGAGAGIQADLATLRDLGVYGCSVVTTVTAQNTRAMTASTAVDADTVRAQLMALAADLPPAAVKIGALGSSGAAAVLLELLESLDAYVVWDPVGQASVGGPLAPELPQALRERLLLRADMVTPNAGEAAAWGLEGADPAGAAAELLRRGARGVLLKGGHTSEPAIDYAHTGERGFWLEGERLDTDAGHGGGCTLASAMAAAHALGHDRDELPVIAKAYLSQGLRQGETVGAGRRPVGHHGWPGTLADLPRVHLRRPWPTPRFPGMEAPIGLYVIADNSAWVRRLVALGVPSIQLRIKARPEAELRAEIEAAVAAVAGSDARLFINDHWRMAIGAGAYGVHLGQEDLAGADLERIADAGLRLGISCHDYFEIARAHALAPSYIALGPIFATASKEVGFAPQGLERLARWTALLGDRYRLTAIGGIDEARIADVVATGVGGACVLRAVTAARDPAAAVAALQERMAPQPDAGKRCQRR